jgi:dolichol-phosphate mannosyltransferase
MDLSIVIPCYNEIDNVPKLRREFFPVAVELAKTRTVEVVLVDDGSTDGTWDALHEAFGGGKTAGIAVRLERHCANRGLGAALRTGFGVARGEVVVATDSDGTYKFSEIPALLERLTPEVDIVTASPYHPQGGVAGVPPYRLILSRGDSLLYRLLVNWNIYTYTALFRAYRWMVLEHVPFESDGFLAGTELLVNGLLLGHRVAEYPTVLHARAHGLSKAKIARTILAHLRFQWRILLHRLGVTPLVKDRQPVGRSA